VRPSLLGRLACLLVLVGCVDEAFGPGNYDPATVRVALALPAGTPAVWQPVGETLYVSVRRAGRVEPIVQLAAIVTGATEVTLDVPLSQQVERFVATAEVRYGASLLFLAFDVVQLTPGLDTAIILVARYVGPGARAVSYTLGARDSTLIAGDTASLVPLVRDSLGQTIPNVPVRYVASRPSLIGVDSAGVLTALPGSLDTARVTGYLPMGLSSGLVVRVVTGNTPPGTKRWVGGRSGAPNAWSEADNWTPVGVPGSADSVVVESAAFDPMLTTPDTIARLEIRSGGLTLNGHTLVVTGDLSTEGGGGGGQLVMQDARDTLRVLGNARFAGQASEEGLNNGLLMVRGDLDIPDLGGGTGFAARDDHRTLLNGASPQRLSVGSGNSGAAFGHLEIANTAGSVLIGGEHQIAVTRSLRVSTPVTIDNGSGGNGDVQLEVGDSLVMVAGSRLTVVELTLGGGMAVAGAFVPQPAAQFRVRFQGSGQQIQSGLDYRDVEINGDALLTGPTTFAGSLNIFGSLDLGGHPLIVTGSLHTENGEGRLIMRRPADRLEVRGDATFEGDSVSGDLTDGILRIAGRFNQLRYSNKRNLFRASGSHRTVLDGAAPQSVMFMDAPTFGHLEFANAGALVTVAANRVVVSRTMRISTPARVESAVDEGPTLALDVGDSLILATGSTLFAGGLVARGALTLAGTLDVRNVEFAGTNQVIPSQVAYRNVDVTGSARLSGRTTVSDFLWLRGPAATLTLAGHTLQAASLTTGDGAGVLVQASTLVMQQPTDSLIVAGAVALGSDATPGSLSAGVLVVGNGLYQYGTPTAFQPTGTHRTVLAGASGATIDFEHPGTGAGASYFRHLEIGDTASVFFRTNATVTGTLSGGNTPVSPVVSGSGRTITARGVDVAGLVFRNVRLSIGDLLTRLDTVTFDQQDATATPLTIVHPGGAMPFTLTGLRFQTTPSTGAYISATDAAPSDGQTLTVNMVASQPSDGSAQTITGGGAIVNWTDGSVPFAWAVVSGGLSFSCGVTTTGAAYCWGQNGSGQLGDGTTETRLAPVAVGGGRSFATVAAGGSHSCALTTLGTAFCWGDNTYGQLGDGTATSALTPVGVTGGLSFISLAAGEQHTCGVATGGSLYCWGRNGSGQLGDGSTTNRAAPTLASGGLTFASVSAGIGAHTCALTSESAAYCWGRNTNGQLGDATTNDRLVPTAVAGGLTFASISATGNEHSCGVTTGGAGYCWGWNFYGNLGDGSTTTRLSPTAVSGGLVFGSIAAGANGFSCGLTTAGAAYCWGVNNVGQLGDGTTAFSRTTPTAVTGGVTFSFLRAGFAHVSAVAANGSGYSWGAVLGDGTSNRSSVPVLLSVPAP